MKIYRISRQPFLLQLESLKPQMVAAAQKVHDAWEQDEDGIDVEYGAGGICQDIASAICEVLSENNINCSTIHNEMGEQHVWAVAWEHESKDPEEGYNGYHIDIDPSWYESGGGYVWKKILDVTFAEDMITISRADDELIDYLMEY